MIQLHGKHDILNVIDTVIECGSQHKKIFPIDRCDEDMAHLRCNVMCHAICRMLQILHFLRVFFQLRRILQYLFRHQSAFVEILCIRHKEIEKLFMLIHQTEHNV